MIINRTIGVTDCDGLKYEEDEKMFEFGTARFKVEKCEWCDYLIAGKTKNGRSINGTFIEHVFNNHQIDVVMRDGQEMLDEMKKALDEELK